MPAVERLRNLPMRDRRTGLAARPGRRLPNADRRAAWVEGGELFLRAVSFLTGKPRRAEAWAPLGDAPALGERVAAQLL